jgi:RNA polymerase sigma factor (sigma-70 family)
LEDFAALIEQHQAMVFRTLARLTGERDQLEDLAQEVFLRLLRGSRSFQGRAKITTYLYQIIVNVVRDEWESRRQSRRQVSIDEEAGNWEERLPATSLDPGQAIDRRQLLGAVEAAMGQLSLQDRTILVLYHQEEKSYEEIAAVLGLPLGTVKTNLHRARVRLRAAMGEWVEACRMSTSVASK